VETFGPKFALVPVKLDGVKLSIMSGSGNMTGLTVGNPEGYKTPNAISVGSATLALKPGSLLSDKIVIQKIEVIAPEITFEGGLSGNNLSQLQANLQKTTGGSSSTTDTNAAPASQGNRKLQVDEFAITGIKLHISITDLAGQSTIVAIPDIHLSQLGAGPEGISAAELTKRVLNAIEQEAVKVAKDKGMERLTKQIDKAAGENAGKLGKKLGDLLKK
jgi:uncharacterized protein involved in outer membrane biogenesis